MEQTSTEDNYNHSKYDAQTFYREILLTYRLIFGQDKSSWHQLASSRSSPIFETGRSEEIDPLLRELMSRPWRKQAIFSEIRAGPSRPAYPASDFAFFGNRLQTLQDFVATQAPDDFWSLMRDRRDLNRLWTIRSAVIFGLGATFLAVVQIVVGILQVVHQA